jgi:hydroxymethylglutaryl-CoA reductase
MVKRGGGVKKVQVRKLEDSLNGKGSNYSFDIDIDVCGAMGANITNTLAEKAK